MLPSRQVHFSKKIEANLMKHVLLVSLLVFCSSSAGPAQAEQKAVVSSESSLKVNELASLPEGLAVSHTPDPVHATLHTPSLSGVQWKHSTTVSSTVGPVKIIEFGYFVERNGQWEFPYGIEVPYVYTSNDFAEKYNCPSSELQPGKSYTDAWNRSVIDCVPEQIVKWYFIGLDSKGNRVKGEASIKLLAERAPSVQGPRS
jgi:hypothetical protein